MHCNSCNSSPCCCNKAGVQIVGPQGPMGPQGPAGQTGPQGPIGPISGGGQLFGMHNIASGIILSFSQINQPSFLTLQPCLRPVQDFETTGGTQSGANFLLFNGVGGTFKRLFIRTYDPVFGGNPTDQPVRITLRKNGADTALKLVIPAGGLGDYSNIMDTVIANGITDEFCLKVEPDFTPLTNGFLYINHYQIWLT